MDRTKFDKHKEQVIQEVDLYLDEMIVRLAEDDRVCLTEFNLKVKGIEETRISLINLFHEFEVLFLLMFTGFKPGAK